MKNDQTKLDKIAVMFDDKPFSMEFTMSYTDEKFDPKKVKLDQEIKIRQ
jgi:hypothetical protein